MAQDSSAQAAFQAWLSASAPVQPEELATPWQVVKHPFWDAKR